MRDGRRGVLLAALGALVVAVVIGFALGRATAPDDAESQAATTASAIRVVDGIPVGVAHSRAGALAAADNYVAVATETSVQSPERFEQLVRTVYAPDRVDRTLREAQRIREQSPDAIENYAGGGKALAVVAAHRLDSYDGATAVVTTWGGGFTWGPQQRPTQRWSVVTTRLRWAAGRWIVEALDAQDGPTPAPTVVAFNDDRDRRTGTFEAVLRGMTGPFYGAP